MTAARDHPSNRVPVGRAVAPAGPDSADQVLEDPVVDQVAAPAVVVLALAVEVADPVVAPRALLVAVVARASRANRSGQSVKNLKCGRRRV